MFAHVGHTQKRRPRANQRVEADPANMRRWPNVCLLLDRRRKRWANSEPTLGQRLMFAGDVLDQWTLICEP